MEKRGELLPFISNKDLYSHVWKVLSAAKKANSESEERFFSNVVDPFSAMFDSLCQGVSMKDWVKQEKSRQIQKTLQNSLGTFHQEIIGSMRGWRSLGTGKIIDVINEEKKIIAEIKNKFNTTKGNHKIAIYDDLRRMVTSKCPGYTAFYVEIIPPNKKTYNKPFTPSDNKTGTRRTKYNKIRVIDGKSFYEIASGDPDGLKKIYKALPIVICDLLRRAKDVSKDNSAYMDLFNRAY